MKTLSVFMIVKNEEVMIEDALKSAQGADEIIVVDTGSTDRTIEIARRYTDKIYTDYTWNDDFSEAKNHAMSLCTGDFVIGLDADCRFKEGSLRNMRDFIQTAEKDCYRVKLVWNDLANEAKSFHFREKLFRRGKVKYVGRVHEHPDKIQEGTVDATIVFLYSPAHYSDPDRNIRCLLKDDMTKPRNQFYLGREYFERKQYEKAIEWLETYSKSNSWPPEKAEAYITLARCYWYTNNGDKAREACGKAIVINPMFKEANLLMAAMHFEPNKSKWNKLAEISTNEDVMFVRT